MEPRQLPPHQIELDAIQQNRVKIFHKVFFPNDTEEVMQHKTTTLLDKLTNEARELCVNLAPSDVEIPLFWTVIWSHN